jgi:hypothetical protein
MSQLKKSGRWAVAVLAVACTATSVMTGHVAARPNDPVDPKSIAPGVPRVPAEPRIPPRPGPNPLPSGSPRFAAAVVSFRAIDESGADWSGSDEVIGHFDSNVDAGFYTRVYGDVDSGDLVEFASGDRCLAPRTNCSTRGVAGPLQLELELWEDDDCNPFLPSCFDTDTGPLDPADDLIGREVVYFSVTQLVDRMDSVGDAINFPVRLGGPCGHQEPGGPVCGHGPLTPTGPEYELRIVIKRYADAPEIPPICCFRATAI